jgi:hypothetical protein
VAGVLAVLGVLAVAGVPVVLGVGSLREVLVVLDSVVLGLWGAVGAGLVVVLKLAVLLGLELVVVLKLAVRKVRKVQVVRERARGGSVQPWPEGLHPLWQRIGRVRGR